MLHRFTATLLLGLFVSTAHASLVFDFSFINAANGGGTVTGVVRGLAGNSTGPASSVEVTGNTLGYGLGEYIGLPQTNSWTVTDGAITAVQFQSYGILNTPPDVTDSSLEFLTQGSPPTFFVGLTPETGRPLLSAIPEAPFTPRPSTVPAPPVLWLLGVGLLGVALSYRGRRRNVRQK